jgi:hypothetical protein
MKIIKRLSEFVLCARRHVARKGVIPPATGCYSKLIDKIIYIKLITLRIIYRTNAL